MILIKTELFYLFLTTLFCGLLWIPYVTERFLDLELKIHVVTKTIPLTFQIGLLGLNLHI